MTKWISHRSHITQKPVMREVFRCYDVLVLCVVPKGIMPKEPYPPCLRMADRALLAGYPRNYLGQTLGWTIREHSSDYLLIPNKVEVITGKIPDHEPIHHMPVYTPKKKTKQTEINDHNVCDMNKLERVNILLRNQHRCGVMPTLHCHHDSIYAIMNVRQRR